MKRKAAEVVQGFRAIDGGGVQLVRVLGNQTMDAFDPFLMLDSFDSTNYDDWRAGFPFHPHRGIETVSYIRKGGMHHQDTMGFEDTVHDGEVQWMCAGSGVEHEETIPEAPQLQGLQLWLNLPAAEKMSTPTYHAIKRDAIESIPVGKRSELRLLAGNFTDEKGQLHEGYHGEHLPLDYYEVTLSAGDRLTFKVGENKSVMAFTLVGRATIGELPVAEKSAVRLINGDEVELIAHDGDAVVMVMVSDRLDEPVAWGGPIVMNTRQELMQAFREYENGTFIKAGLARELAHPTPKEPFPRTALYGSCATKQ